MINKNRSKTIYTIIRVNILDAYDGNKFWIVNNRKQLYRNGKREKGMLSSREITRGIANGSIKTDWAAERAKIFANESEFIRIVKTLDPKNCVIKDGEYTFLKDIVEVKIGKSHKHYDDLFQDGKDCGIIYVNGRRFKKIFCNSGQNRAKKAMFIAEELYDKVIEINRCGVPKDATNYACKWEAYYGMICTDGRPVTMPNIVVVDDCEKLIEEDFDVVTGKVITDKKGKSEYDLNPEVKTEKRKIPILPFDGAGLVSVELAKQWVSDLGLDYLPSAWQFRMIPGIKGCVYTFDVNQFAEVYHVWKIKDYWGRTWDLYKDKIDCILTKSQFKFAKMYNSFKDWKTAFDTDLYGYHRTFNISEVSVPYSSTEKYKNCVKGHTILSYQPLQTLNLSDDEIKKICAPTISNLKKVHTDIDAFIRWRGLDRNGDEDISYINPALKALQYNHSLANDPYVHKLILDELINFRRINHIRLQFNSSFQILVPDVFAIAEYVFGFPVKGLLGAKEVYNKYYYNRGVKQLDLIRFPHIANEHCLADVANESDQNWNDMAKWYKYQNVGYVTGIWDSFAMREGGADFDGDHIYGLADQTLINAVRRQEVNTIYFERDPEEGKHSAKIKADDYLALAASDSVGFQNDIGRVVNNTSKLWSKIIQDNPNNNKIMDYIKVMSVADCLTIDFVKTGIKAQVPKEIKAELRKYKNPYFFQFRSTREYQKAMSVDRNIKARKKINKTESKGLALYSDNPSTMNRLTHYMDAQISNLQADYNVPKFDWTILLQGDYDQQNSETYKNVKRKLIVLNKRFKSLLFDEYVGPSEFSCNKRDCQKVNKDHIRLFFRECRNQLLTCQPDTNKLVNDLIICYYADTDTEINNRSILWNCFSPQLITRIKGKKSKGKIYNLEKLKKQHAKILEKKKTVKHKYDNKKDIPIIDNIDAKVSITNCDKKYINRQFKTQRSKRLYYALLYIWLKINAGKRIEHLIKIGTNPKYEEVSKLQIQRLSGLQNHAFSDAIQSCCARKMIDINFKDISVPKIRVLYKKQGGKEIELPDTCKRMRSWIDHYVPARHGEEMELEAPETRYYIKKKREERPSNVSVVRVEDGKVYPSIAIASGDNQKTSVQAICSCCKGKKYHKTSGGYHWMYLYDYQRSKDK